MVTYVIAKNEIIRLIRSLKRRKRLIIKLALVNSGFVAKSGLGVRGERDSKRTALSVAKVVANSDWTDNT